ncbi:leucine-rich repeat protein SHOC-2-like isoform X1 [Osmia bicornis bicornis]|uniref:leucine-rich repeat protein SHOC-2-like isoform X1 n=3 Tax=Osmia bicornis bicornis TaxID=1437191 RepID=UPI0010F8803D|nr:leucine-rich repeat protein SHOC-2-like isoform X1 [Osmia bicornis bicornis]XP_046144160.1 leucine-rich repeat protein SHOC-2-like isoform X1 [Osmia bicornis bicornis]XP_046144161.1 leucine-rich repeat protein SHOC-2-like isoform X1 [Osmia bicornis bicornis]XP_046144162.1 leucine-rich repeat protein SHOC-2-like isoform X1 [Osmia bicornis bicornis]XP_046144163.1 leucine-rich repeat protein SHOC-2-like isoform X1 [Osmia bicornis bicornis]
MDPDSAEMVNEIKNKVILHWNCRGLMEFPDAIRIYGSHIQEIYLKWNKLTTLPPWIIELFNVTNIYLYGNMIKEIPSELCQMNQLTVLDLSSNKLEKLPSCIGCLINLKSLLLNENFIDRLPTEMNKMHNLEILSIAGNKFVVLPEWIGSLPKLKELNADNNHLKELPNRLTLSPKLSVISVCSNRLRYLPLNGFVSSPCIRFDANVCLNYLSYPLLYQLTSQVQDSFMYDQRTVLGYGCFKTYCGSNVLHTNIKLNIKINTITGRDTNFMIELPRQLLKVYNLYENAVVSLWELALRKIYTERYKHTLNISTSPININVQYEPVAISNCYQLDFPMYSINYGFYNLLINGPTSICVNSPCQQPIFTEAWVIVGISYCTESITTVALCCCKRCASEFSKHSNMTISHNWYCIN